MVRLGADERLALATRPASAAARIYETLRERIVSLQLLPGAPISEKQFVEAFGVSRTPVREAVLRLAEDQLVDIYPQSGTFVSLISESAARDAMAIRIALERSAVREAAKRASQGDVEELQRLLRRQRLAASERDIADFHEADEAMHRALAVIAGHPNFWRVIKREKAHVDRLRLLTLQVPGRFEAVLTQHEAIVAGVAARDPVAAEAAMDAHLQRVLPGLDAIRETYPDNFETEAAARPRRAAKS